MNPYVSLAKLAVENYIKDGKIIDPPEDLPEEFLKKRAGVFVTIEKCASSAHPPMRRKLRGCIGTYLPTKINIAEEIIHNAVAAACEDYRFEPVQKEELSSLSYTVYILNSPEPVKDIKKLDPKKFGIIIKTGPFTYPSGSEREKREHALFDLPNEPDVVFDDKLSYKTGLLLPDLEGVDTVEQQISIASQKGGIDPAKEKIFIYRFTVEKYVEVNEK